MSLTWQFRQFRLSGPRVKAYVRFGAAGSGTIVMYPPKPPNELIATLGDLSRQGMNIPVLAVRTVNVGRMSIQVHGFSVEFPDGTSISQRGNALDNEPFPFDLAAHSEKTWTIPLEQVIDFARAGTEVMKSDDFSKVRMVVKLVGDAEARSDWLALT